MASVVIGTAVDMGDDSAISTSEAVTRGVRVSVAARFDPSRSQPQRGLWFFLYTITIANEGTEIVQLLTRHWVINDAYERSEEVRGDGVVGKQPTLEPGQSFTYTSGCPLGTEFGSMRGGYGMVTADGEEFEVEIAEFALCPPYTVQ